MWSGAAWSCSDIYSGCSGNFTIERILASEGRFRLHGNDVTLYSSALGRYFAGKPLTVRLKPLWKRDAWLEAFPREPAVAPWLPASACIRVNGAGSETGETARQLTAQRERPNRTSRQARPPVVSSWRGRGVS